MCQYHSLKNHRTPSIVSLLVVHSHTVNNTSTSISHRSISAWVWSFVESDIPHEFTWPRQRPHSRGNADVRGTRSLVVCLHQRQKRSAGHPSDDRSSQRSFCERARCCYHGVTIAGNVFAWEAAAWVRSAWPFLSIDGGSGPVGVEFESRKPTGWFIIFRRRGIWSSRNFTG